MRQYRSWGLLAIVAWFLAGNGSLLAQGERSPLPGSATPSVESHLTDSSTSEGIPLGVLLAAPSSLSRDFAPAPGSSGPLSRDFAPAPGSSGPLSRDLAPAPGSAPPAPASQPPAEDKKYPEIRLTGFFQLDSAIFAQSAESLATLGDIQDGTGFRRARLAATGSLSATSSYLMEFDFAQAQARFVDVWGQLNETPWGKLRIGRFRQPYGMTEQTSVRELALMERPTAFAMAPFRQTGIMLFDTFGSERGTYAVSGYRTLSDNFGNVFGDAGGFGTAARLTWLPIDSGDCRVVHVGFGHSFLDPARDQLQIATQDEIFVGQQPNLGPTGLSVQPLVGVPPFVNSGLFNVNQANLFNLEGAVSIGRALVQAEHRWTRLALPAGDDPTVTAGYLTVRWILTGEVLPYNRSGGVFGRVKPLRPLNLACGDWGAWELVGRLSTINLNPMFGLVDVPGPTRRLKSASLGLNWYWTNNARCQFEWVNGNLNDPLLGDSVTNTFAGRIQFDF